MNLAFCLFRYFPFGGLQRDFVRIAKACIARGHKIDVYTMRWEGEQFPSLPVTLIPSSGWQNHTRIQHFIEALQKIFQEKKYDKIIGFNKMPGLDVYYAADPCLKSQLQKKHPTWFKLLPRYRVLLNNEWSVFSSTKNTKILLIAENQKKEFIKQYQTPANRFYLLKPGINPKFIAPDNANEIRKKTRYIYQISENQFLLLFVGSGFRTKGLDRVLTGIAHCPEGLRQKIKLFIIGQDQEKKFLRQAKSLQIQDNIQFFGGRDDVNHFMLAADLFVHPARSENTGTVLLEALASGLPILTTDVCGYAHYIESAKAGVILPSPFNQTVFTQTLITILQSTERSNWKKNGIAFAKQNDLYNLAEQAANFIESEK